MSLFLLHHFNGFSFAGIFFSNMYLDSSSLGSFLLEPLAFSPAYGRLKSYPCRTMQGMYIVSIYIFFTSTKKLIDILRRLSLVQSPRATGKVQRIGFILWHSTGVPLSPAQLLKFFYSLCFIPRFFYLFFFLLFLEFFVIFFIFFFQFISFFLYLFIFFFNFFFYLFYLFFFNLFLFSFISFF